MRVDPSHFADEVAGRHRLHADASTPLVGRGSVNHVVVVRTGSEHIVVRFPIDPLRHDEYEVETWALAHAAAHGIPSPQTIARGYLRGVPYVVQTLVEGAPGTEAATPHLWRTLGEYARTIHRIPIPDDAPAGLFSRFGRDPASAWAQHVDYNLSRLNARDPLIELGVYRLAWQPRIRTALQELAETPLSFGLVHGDLSPRNLVLPATDRPVLLDWGCACVTVVPFGDVRPLILARNLGQGPSDAELTAFADGLGAQLDQIEATLQRVVLLHALDLVRWALDRRPDRLDDVVASSRTELARNPALSAALEL